MSQAVWSRSHHGARSRWGVLGPPGGRAVRLPAHDVRDQAVKGGDSGPSFAPPEDASVPHVPCRQIGQRPTALVLMLHPAATPRRGGGRGVLAPPGLNTRLFIATEHVILRDERLALPHPGVEVENAPRLGEELRMGMASCGIARGEGHPGSATAKSSSR